MTKTTLKWRLSKLPTVEELLSLVENKLITQEEAKEILFTSETDDSRDKKSLEDEIKFLRALVEKLSNNSRTTIYETIREVKVPYYEKQWYKPYEIWCKADNSTTTANYSVTASTGGDMITMLSATNNGFSNIKTF